MCPTMVLSLRHFTHNVKSHVIAHVKAKAKEQHVNDIIMA